MQRREDGRQRLVDVDVGDGVDAGVGDLVREDRPEAVFHFSSVSVDVLAPAVGLVRGQPFLAGDLAFGLRDRVSFSGPADGLSLEVLRRVERFVQL